MADRKITREAIAAEPWGEAWLREMDLVIAANVLESLRSGKTVYSSELRGKLAERCAPLDGGLEERKLTMIRVEPDEKEWRRVPRALEELKGLPRGHWAVLEKDGRYDAYMSDGCGGVATESGHKFTNGRPDAGDLSFLPLYGNVLGYIAYMRRSQIENEIMEHSFRQSGIAPGHVVRDAWIGGKRYSKIEFLRLREGYYVGQGDAVEVRMTRRGVKAVEKVMPVASFAQLAGVVPVLPPVYDDPGNAERLVAGFRPSAEAEKASAPVFR